MKSFLELSRSTVRGRSLLAVVLITVAILAGCNYSDNSEEQSIPLVWQKAVENGFSGAVLVRYKGEILLNTASGQVDRLEAIPNTSDTIFDMGSLTKQFTGAVVLALQEDGLLNVEDTLSTYFNDVPTDKAGITIHQLLTHTAGFAEAIGEDYDPISREEFLSLVWSTSLTSQPGTTYEYSNVGYSIAAAIVERVAGASYESVLRDQLLDSAGMQWTGYVQPDWLQRTVASGYFEDPNIAAELGLPASILAIELPWAEDGPYWHLRGNGGLLTTTDDLLKWHDFLASEEVLGPSSLEAYYGRHADEGNGESFYGYGWVTEDTPVGPLLHHDGGNGFYYSLMLRFFDEDLVIITLSNEGNRASEELAWNIARTAVPKLKNWNSSTE